MKTTCTYNHQDMTFRLRRQLTSGRLGYVKLGRLSRLQVILSRVATSILNFGHSQIGLSSLYKQLLLYFKSMTTICSDPDIFESRTQTYLSFT